jgi:uncharacterized protein (TIGR02757 family)
LGSLPHPCIWEGAQKLKSVSTILAISLHLHITNFQATEKRLREGFTGFKHRFTTGDDVSGMLVAIKKMIKTYGSILNAFLKGYSKSDENILPSLSFFVKRLTQESGGIKNSLIPIPDRGSACKRLNLFFRWMVRRDAVDPGGWDMISPSKLIIPLDTHMYNIGSGMKMTMRKQANMVTAIQITDAFKRLIPEDPVKYDFALTRLGIRRDGDPARFLESI